MVIEKPMQFTMVRAVPFDSAGALRATKVENKGESATTTIPQNKRNATMIMIESLPSINGDATQQRHDKSKATAAVFLAPAFKETYPPITQAIPPMPIIENDKKGTLGMDSGCRSA